MKDLILSIVNIFRYTGRGITVIRNTVINIIFLGIIISLLVGVLVNSNKTLSGKTILLLQLHGKIVEERHPVSALEQYVTRLSRVNEEQPLVVLQDVLDCIDNAAHDPAIKAIQLDLTGLDKASMDQMQLIGDALDRFRQQAKKVIAVQDYYSQTQYYLASYADNIIVNPMGGVLLHGFGVYPLYYKQALEKLKVNYHVFRVGTYKSAIEPIIRDSMSDEAKAQNRSWLNSLWSSYTEHITARRNISANTIVSYIEDIEKNLTSVAGDSAQLAIDQQLVDHIFNRIEVEEYLKSVVNSPKLHFVHYRNYLETIPKILDNPIPDGNSVGVIIAEGMIVGGDKPAGYIGSDSLVKKLRIARNNKSIKAVVLRINTGGGSAFASEIIRQEILELKRSGKPVLVSMGSVAASGGYWISADADEIWASETTLTGSIGIFGAIPTFERSLSALGVSSDGVGTTSLASGMNLTLPLSPAVQSSIQLTVDAGYARFLSIVHNGRNIPEKQLKKIAEGRVFSGKQAKELNLIDEIGSLWDVIEKAAETVQLPKENVTFIQLQDDTLHGRLIAKLSAAVSFPWKGAKEHSVNTYFNALFTQIKNDFSDVLLLNDPHHVYAHSMLRLPM